ncbi:NAD-dependent epimerase/dehydratase family protein [Methylophilales bacterium]|nr:NAD-dependent epimerase/dehydratase family protein [Methylophilales bacterium]
MNEYKRILVTGGSGFIGRAISKLRPNWIYMSSADCDITKQDCLQEYLRQTKPEAIIHLAARVGGIGDSHHNQAEFLYLNNLINTNLIHQAYKAGIKRVLSCLSTCCFPDTSKYYPMKEADLLKGEPQKSNYGYAFAKRMLYLQSKYYSECYKVNFNTFSPSNIYGENNNSDDGKSHFISSLVKKFAKASDGDEITFWGTGKPLRQHLYVNDLAEIIILLLAKHNNDLPVIVAPNENLSIKQHIELMKEISNKKLIIKFNGELDGQFRKDGSNEELLKLIGEYNFTNLRDGLIKTYNWYQKKLV